MPFSACEKGVQWERALCIGKVPIPIFPFPIPIPFPFPLPLPFLIVKRCVADMFYPGCSLEKKRSPFNIIGTLLLFLFEEMQGIMKPDVIAYG